MDYKKIYNNLVTSRILLNRVKNNDGLLEKHHIIPKCLGGSNDKHNIVLLTPREHYLAHWLLCKIHKDKVKAKMVYAFFCMCRKNHNHKRGVTSKMYERAKIYISNFCHGKNHHSFKKEIWDEKARKEISNRMLGVNNPMYGKSPWNKGLTKDTSDIVAKYIEKSLCTKKLNPTASVPRTDEFKQRAAAWMTGVPKTEECKIKLSILNKGKKLSQETKDKMSATRKIKQSTANIYTCPYCNFEGKGSAMFRWHFNNCKFK